jgi:hypothetical protein
MHGCLLTFVSVYSADQSAQTSQQWRPGASSSNWKEKCTFQSKSADETCGAKSYRDVDECCVPENGGLLLDVDLLQVLSHPHNLGLKVSKREIFVTSYLHAELSHLGR